MKTYTIQDLRSVLEEKHISDEIYQPGDVLFHEGDRCEKLFLVINGEICAERYRPGGKQIIFFRAGKGSLLSEECLFFAEYLYTGLATKPTQAYVFPLAYFKAAVRNNDRLFEQIVLCLAEKFSDSLFVRELLGIRSAEDRLLEWIKWQHTNTNDFSGFEDRLGSIGAELGLTRESIYRAFARLEASNQISREGGTIRLIPSN